MWQLVVMIRHFRLVAALRILDRTSTTAIPAAITTNTKYAQILCDQAISAQDELRTAVVSEADVVVRVAGGSVSVAVLVSRT